jgi:hypothetical protein
LTIFDVYFGYFYQRSIRYGDDSLTGLIIALWLPLFWWWLAIGVILNVYIRDFFILFGPVYIFLVVFLVIPIYFFYKKRLNDKDFKDQIVSLGEKYAVRVYSSFILLWLIPLFIIGLVHGNITQLRKQEGFYGIEFNTSDSSLYFLSFYNGNAFFCRYSIEKDSTILIGSGIDDVVWYSLSQSPKETIFSFIEYNDRSDEEQFIVLYSYDSFTEIDRIRIPKLVCNEAIFVNDSTIILSASQKIRGRRPYEKQSLTDTELYKININTHEINRVCRHASKAIYSLSRFRNDTLFSIRVNENSRLGLLIYSNTECFNEFDIAYNFFDVRSNSILLDSVYYGMAFSHKLNSMVFQNKGYFWCMNLDTLQANILFEIGDGFAESAQDITFSSNSSIFFYTSHTNPFKIYGYDLSNRKPYYDITIRYSDIGILDN